MPQDHAAILQQAFARSGPGALPYAKEFSFLVQQHLIELVTDLPSLHVKTREYVHIDGRSAQLLLGEGTLPMFYQGHKYNIPVAIWLPEQYPLAAPMAYVVPTPDMVIRPRHSFVDASGLVQTPYISQWQYPASNLRDMAQDMSMHFGDDPPLFSKPKSWSPPSLGTAAHQQQQQQQPARPSLYGGSSSGVSSSAADDTLHVHNPLAAGAAYGGTLSSSSYTRPTAKPNSSTGPNHASAGTSTAATGGMDQVWNAMMAALGPGSGTAAASAAAQPSPGPQQQKQHQQQPSPPRENPSVKLQAAFRTAAVATLNSRLHASLTALAGQAAAEAQEQLELHARLRQRGEQLQAEVAVLQSERVALDKLSQELSISSKQLDSWLAENEQLAAAARDPTQLDPDSVIIAADPLSQQALEVQAQDLALEDALYALDKVLNQGAIEPDSYLKQVRAVCRRQFFVRVLGNKVAAQQQEQQLKGVGPQQQQQQLPGVGPPPRLDVQRAGSMGRPVVLPQGDSWANAGIMASSPQAAAAAAASNTSWYPTS